MKTKRVYADISKVEPQDDGTLKVYGYASSGAVDSDEETITPEAMKAAIPDYMKFGAVREMHGASAAGTALSAEVQEDGKTAFAAHIVDPVACLKVTTGVYKGFSIGGKVTSRNSVNKSIIEGLRLVEVSLVDRPANPEALMTMWKGEKSPEDEVAELADMLDKGIVTPAQLLEMVRKNASGEASATDAAPVAVVVQAEAVVTDAPPTSAEKGASVPDPEAAPAEVEKGMGDVSFFADMLCSIGYLVSGATWEADYEGDNSPIPEALRAWLKNGLAIFNDMAAEETAELVSSLSAKAEAVTLAKKGAKFSKQTKEQLSTAHAAVKALDACMEGLAYKDDDGGDVEDADKAATVGSADTVTKSEDKTAAASIDEAIAKAIAPLNASLEKLTKEKETLAAQVLEMGKRAAPGKALLQLMKGAEVLPVVVTNKADDSTSSGIDKPEVKLAAEGTLERATQEMQKVFQAPGRVLVR